MPRRAASRTGIPTLTAGSGDATPPRANRPNSLRLIASRKRHFPNSATIPSFSKRQAQPKAKARARRCVAHVVTKAQTNVRNPSEAGSRIDRVTIAGVRPVEPQFRFRPVTKKPAGACRPAAHSRPGRNRARQNSRDLCPCRVTHAKIRVASAEDVGRIRIAHALEADRKSPAARRDHDRQRSTSTCCRSSALCGEVVLRSGERVAPATSRFGGPARETEGCGLAQASDLRNS